MISRMEYKTIFGNIKEMKIEKIKKNCEMNIIAQEMKEIDAKISSNLEKVRIMLIRELMIVLLGNRMELKGYILHVKLEDECGVLVAIDKREVSMDSCKVWLSVQRYHKLGCNADRRFESHVVRGNDWTFIKLRIISLYESYKCDCDADKRLDKRLDKRKEMEENSSGLEGYGESTFASKIARND